MLDKEQRELILMVGMPGAGKSTYLENHRTEFSNHTILSIDRIIRRFQRQVKDLTKQDVSFDQVVETFNNEAGKILNYEISRAVRKGQNIVVDLANATAFHRSFKIAAARDSNEYDYNVKAIVIHAPEEQEHARRLWTRAVREKRFTSVSLSSFRKLEIPSDGEVDQVLHIGTPPKRGLFHEYNDGATDNIIGDLIKALV